MNHDSTSPYKIQKKPHTESHTSNYSENRSRFVDVYYRESANKQKLAEEYSRRLLHTGSFFDPTLSSPPNEFIQKLKLRMDVYYDAPVTPAAYKPITLETK